MHCGRSEKRLFLLSSCPFCIIHHSGGAYNGGCLFIYYIPILTGLVGFKQKNNKYIFTSLFLLLISLTLHNQWLCFTQQFTDLLTVKVNVFTNLLFKGNVQINRLCDGLQ